MRVAVVAVTLAALAAVAVALPQVPTEFSATLEMTGGHVVKYAVSAEIDSDGYETVWERRQDAGGIELADFGHNGHGSGKHDKLYMFREGDSKTCAEDTDFFPLWHYVRFGRGDEKEAGTETVDGKECDVYTGAVPWDHYPIPAKYYIATENNVSYVYQVELRGADIIKFHDFSTTVDKSLFDKPAQCE